MQQEKLRDLIEPVVRIAAAAGQRILDIYARADLEVSTKDDSSPITAADRAAHQLIVAELRALDPKLPVLSEESAAIPFAERRAWPAYWLVDPLDGTKEFIARNGEFTVNIALISGHAPVFGVVHVPVTGRTYHGARGHGAFERDADGRISPIHVAPRAAHPIRVVGSRSHPTPAMDEYLARLGEHVMLAVGSSLKFCMVATGQADIYPRLGPTSEWDTAAAQAVVECAGGKVITFDRAPLAYNTKDDLLNPHFLVYGDDRRDWVG